MRAEYIPNFDNKYFVVEDGRVFSLVRGKQKELKADVNHSGYKRVTLSKNGKTYRFAVHRLVADAFIPNPKNLPVVNHIDHTPGNDWVSNLEWVTASQNMLHASKHGRLQSSTSAGGVAQGKKATKAANDKYSMLIGTSLNGRTLLDFYKSTTTQKPKFKGLFSCDKCNHEFEAYLDESIRKAKDQVCYCRSCSLKR